MEHARKGILESNVITLLINFKFKIPKLKFVFNFKKPENQPE